MPAVAAADETERGPSSSAPLPQQAMCDESATDAALTTALATAVIELNGEARQADELRIDGLSYLRQENLDALIGPAPKGPLSFAQVSQTVMRLSATGLFREITPRVAVDVTSGRVVVTLHVAENPIIRAVRVEGVDETRPADIIDAIFALPERPQAEVDAAPPASSTATATAPAGAATTAGDSAVAVSVAAACGAIVPPGTWLASAEDGSVTPGILWQGLAAAMERATQYLFDLGYGMASVRAQMTSDGVLTVVVDEGRVASLELIGVDESIAPDVRQLLGIAAGEVFLDSRLGAAMEAVERRYPFLRPDGYLHAERPTPRFTVVTEANGILRVERQAGATGASDVVKKVCRSFESFVDSMRPLSGDFGAASRHPGVHTGARDDDFSCEDQQPFARIDGHTLTLRLRARPVAAWFDGEDLIRHTQVTDFAPGLIGQVALFDPKDRVRFTLDGAVRLNTGRQNRSVDGGALTKLAASEKWDGLVGAHGAFPRLRITELGAQFHVLTDTADRWRLGAIDSYLSSILLNRPASEYFRRTGVAAFATVQPLSELTLGAEYRLDDYGSLASLDEVWTVYHRYEAAWPNPPIDDGRMGSVVARLEWSSEAEVVAGSETLWRAPELSLLGGVHGWHHKTYLRTLNTLEVADPGLGGDFEFTRGVSDTTFEIAVSEESGVRLRARGAGGKDLPVQKQEALGGWSALRGYDFKELRGDFSLLGTLEARLGPLVAFADLGAVRAAGTWTDAKLGLGLGLNLGDAFEVMAAWRTDERAHAAPDVRLLFVQTF